MAPHSQFGIDIPATAIRRCKHGYFMYPRGDTYVGRCLELYGEYSEGEVALFKQLVPTGATVIEVGANIGALTVPLAHMAGSQGRLIALEPQRAIFNVLCANLALNGLVHVEAMRAAAGGEKGETAVPLLDYRDKGNFGGVSVDVVGLRATEKVPLVPLDALDLQRLDFVKIDVEGFEADVIAGASAAIRRFRPALFVENDRREHSAKLISMIQDHGYHLWWHFSPLFQPENFNGNPENVMGRVISINMLALPGERGTKVNGLQPVSGPDDWWRRD